MAVNRVTLTINSRQYTVVADESKEYIEKLCNHINEKVAEVRKGGQNVLGERPVVLAALNICDEYFKTLEISKKQEEELEAYRLQLSRLQLAPQQMTIDGSGSKSEIDAANRRIKFLEEHVKELENKLRVQHNNNRKS